MPLEIAPFRGFLGRDRAVNYKAGSASPLAGYRECGAIRQAQAWLLNGRAYLEVAYYGMGYGHWDHRDDAWLMARTQAVYEEAATIVSSLRFEPGGAFQVGPGEVAPSASEPPAPPLTVRLTCPEAPAALESALEVEAIVTGGRAPYSYTWEGSHPGRGPRVAVPTRRPGEHRIAVQVASSDGQTASADATYRVQGALGFVRGLPSRVVFGQSYPIAAQVPPALSGHRILWHASPQVQFAAPESQASGTRILIDRFPEGGLRIWGQIVDRRGATVGELEQITLDVVSPFFRLACDPPAARVGEPVVVRVTSHPCVDDRLIDFRWLEPASSQREHRTDNGREIVIVPPTAEPLALHNLIRVAGTGEELGEVRDQFTATRYAVQTQVLRSGLPARVWIPGEGLRDAPPGAFATGQRLFVTAGILDHPSPADIRWKWSANPGTSLSNPDVQSPTVTRSEPGQVVLHVAAGNASGIELGSASLAFEVVGSEPGTIGVPQSPETLTAAQQAQLLASAAVADAARGEFRQAVATAEKLAGLDSSLADATKRRVLEAAKQAALQFEQQRQFLHAANAYADVRALAPEDDSWALAEQICRQHARTFAHFECLLRQLDESLASNNLDRADELGAELDDVAARLPDWAQDLAAPLRSRWQQQATAYQEAMQAFRDDVQTTLQSNPDEAVAKLAARLDAGGLRRDDRQWLQTLQLERTTAGVTLLPKLYPLPEASAEIPRIVQQWTLQYPEGRSGLKLVFEPDGVSGSFVTAGESETVEGLRYDPASSRILFRVLDRKLSFSGLVNGTRMEGGVTSPEQPGARWTATLVAVQAEDRDGNPVDELALVRPPIALSSTGPAVANTASASGQDGSSTPSGQRGPPTAPATPPGIPSPSPSPGTAAPSQATVMPSRGYFGVTVHDVGDSAAQSLGIDAASGAVLTKVWPESPAARAGLKTGDVIVGCNGTVVRNHQDLSDLMKDARPDARFMMDVHRGRQSLRSEVTLGVWPVEHSQPDPSEPAPPVAPAPEPPARVPLVFGSHTRPPLVGLSAVSAGTREARQLGIETPAGAVLTRVHPGTPAAQAGLRAGDVVVQFGPHDIGNYEDLECATLSCPIGSSQSVALVRGNRRYVAHLTIGTGPSDRETYLDYRHPTDGYSLRLPVSWKISRTNQTPQANVNAHDAIESRDGNYRFHCYLVTKPAPDAARVLADFERITRSDLGREARFSRIAGAGLPTSVAGVPYQADRRVTLYRVALIRQGHLYVIDVLAPVLSDPANPPHVLRTILNTAATR